MKKSKKEIIKGNKLIADFMNIKTELITPYGSKTPSLFSTEVKHKTEDGDYSEVSFERSWDWLMPVINKIEKLEFVNVIMSKTCLGEFSIEISRYSPSYHGVQKNKVVFVKEKTFTKIESVWIATVEFIQWHNQNKHKKI